jgi:hypothetical protein
VLVVQAGKEMENLLKGVRGDQPAISFNHQPAFEPIA